MANIKYLTFILGILVLTGCEKRPETLEEYLPQIEMISAKVTLEGKIEVRAKLIAEGPRGLYYLGFCADSIRNPKIDENQVLTPYLTGDEFTAILGNTFYPGTYSEMYVNAFAANDFAYSTAAPLYLDSTLSVGRRPDVNAPCDLEINEVKLFQNIGSQTYSNVSDVETSGGISKFTATINNSQKVRFAFKELDQRIYTSTYSLIDMDNDQMLVTVLHNGTENIISPGIEIFVNRVENQTFDIVICGANWGFNNSMKTRVRVSL